VDLARATWRLTPATALKVPNVLARFSTWIMGGSGRERTSSPGRCRPGGQGQVEGPQVGRGAADQNGGRSRPKVDGGDLEPRPADEAQDRGLAIEPPPRERTWVASAGNWLRVGSTGSHRPSPRPSSTQTSGHAW